VALGGHLERGADSGRGGVVVVHGEGVGVDGDRTDKPLIEVCSQEGPIKSG
jgi:hypothetical protein